MFFLDSRETPHLISWNKPVRHLHVFGSHFMWMPAQGSGSYLGFVLSLWAPLILFAIYPTIAFTRGLLRRYRRRRKGLCLKCGYDLTGNVTGVCSECGQPIGERGTA